MIRYEYRENDNPTAMPMGTYTMSTHRTLDAAERASIREHTGFYRSPYSTGGAYLQRVIVHVVDGLDVGAHYAPAHDRRWDEETP